MCFVNAPLKAGWDLRDSFSILAVWCFMCKGSIMRTSACVPVASNGNFSLVSQQPLCRPPARAAESLARGTQRAAAHRVISNKYTRSQSELAFAGKSSDSTADNSSSSGLRNRGTLHLEARACSLAHWLT